MAAITKIPIYPSPTHSPGNHKFFLTLLIYGVLCSS